MLRHSLATLAYRLGRALDGAPPDFGDFRAAETVRTPAEILAHMGDLMDWAVGIGDGVHQWHHSTPLPWDAEVARFHAAVANIADALTHTGQIALLRRMHGTPIKPRNYFKAEI